MDQACVNPYCSCSDCDCAPPCTCGLVRTGHSTEALWDAGTQELRYTVTSRYRHATGTAGHAGQGEYEAGGRGGGHEHGGEEHEGHGGGGHEHGGQPPPVSIADPEELLEQSMSDGRREAVLATFRSTSSSPGGHGGHASVRTAEHHGHTIEVLTTYDVRIDGEPMEAHMSVSDDGNVHYHGLPNYVEASAIDLMRRVIDAFPDDYPPVDDDEDR